MLPAMALLFSLTMTTTPLDALPAFGAARARYEVFEFDTALHGFERIADTADINDADRARLLVWIGMCHAEDGALALAMRRFEDAAALDGDVAPLKNMSPKARTMLDDARGRAPRPAPAVEVGPSTKAPPGPDAAPIPVDAARPLRPALIGGAAGVGVGVVALVVATAAGLAATTAAADALATSSAAEAAQRYQGAQLLATIANASLIVAAVGLITGVAGVVVGVTGG